MNKGEGLELTCGVCWHSHFIDDVDCRWPVPGAAARVMAVLAQRHWRANRRAGAAVLSYETAPKHTQQFSIRYSVFMHCAREFLYGVSGGISHLARRWEVRARALWERVHGPHRAFWVGAFGDVASCDLLAAISIKNTITNTIFNRALCASGLVWCFAPGAVVPLEHLRALEFQVPARPHQSVTKNSPEICPLADTIIR